MAAYSINPCDRGSIMNNITITQRPEWHFTLVAWEKRQCHCWCFTAASRYKCSLTEKFRRWGYQRVQKVNEDEVITGVDVV